jgi:hypothetical protein
MKGLQSAIWRREENHFLLLPEFPERENLKSKIGTTGVLYEKLDYEQIS